MSDMCTQRMSGSLTQQCVQVHMVHPPMLPRQCQIASSRMMLLACKTPILHMSPKNQMNGTSCHKHTAY